MTRPAGLSKGAIAGIVAGSVVAAAALAAAAAAALVVVRRRQQAAAQASNQTWAVKGDTTMYANPLNDISEIRGGTMSAIPGLMTGVSVRARGQNEQVPQHVGWAKRSMSLISAPMPSAPQANVFLQGQQIFTRAIPCTVHMYTHHDRQSGCISPLDPRLQDVFTRVWVW